MAKRNESTIHFEPVPSEHATGAIYTQISELILSGELKPGDRLPSERQMMAMFERSRPTIREALRMLERSELIKTLPSSGGAVIIEPTSLSVEQPLETMLALNQICNSELLEYRALNEIATAGWAAQRRSQEDLDHILRHIRQSELVGNNFSEFVRFDLQFHSALAQAGGNRVSSMVNRVMHQLITNKLEEAFVKKTAKEKRDMMGRILATHREIYQAIAEQDVQHAQQIMRDHINLFAEDLTL